MNLSPAVANRIKIEKRVVRKALRAFKEAGYKFSVGYTGKAPMESCSGWFYAVMGNDGWDVIAEFSTKTVVAFSSSGGDKNSLPGSGRAFTLSF